MKYLILLVLLSSCGMTYKACDTTNEKILCTIFGGKDVVNNDSSCSVTQDDLGTTIDCGETTSFIPNPPEDRMCSLDETSVATILTCDDKQLVVSTQPEVEVVNPCPGTAKEVLLKIGDEYVAFYKRYGGFLTVLEENVRYRTTDGTRCYFRINDFSED